MELILDRTFATSDFLTWYCHASPGDTCTVVVPAMQDWHLTMTKTAEDSQLLLDPDGKRPRRIVLNDLMHMFESMQRALVARASQKTA
jgi:hypothetical protein